MLPLDARIVALHVRGRVNVIVPACQSVLRVWMAQYWTNFCVETPFKDKPCLMLPQIMLPVMAPLPVRNTFIQFPPSPLSVVRTMTCPAFFAPASCMDVTGGPETPPAQAEDDVWWECEDEAVGETQRACLAVEVDGCSDPSRPEDVFHDCSANLVVTTHDVQDHGPWRHWKKIPLGPEDLHEGL